MVLLLFVHTGRSITGKCQEIEQELIRRTTMIPRGGYPDESDSDSHDDGRLHDG